MRRPTADELELLTAKERVSFEIADAVNRKAPLMRAAQAFQATVGPTWVHYATRHLTHLKGLEHLTSLNPDRGVFLVSNHRSFFDFYVVSAVLIRSCPWVRGISFPVRSTFFYEGVLGSLVNMAMSGWAMYPPVMRDPKKKAFNQYTLDAIDAQLRTPGRLVGYHPEGKRGTGPDPYQLLPASSGTGRIIYRARPIVVPVFTLGLTNDLPRQIRGNFTGTGAPITIVIGAPLDLERFSALPDEAPTHKALAQHVGETLTALGETERAFRRAEGLPALGPQR